MGRTTELIGRFVGQLEQLPRNEERAALAKLRRGLGKPPGYAPERDGWVLERLDSEVPDSFEAKFCLISSLFAQHPEAGGKGTMGAALRRLKDQSAGDGVERRFVALLNSDEEDLPGRLRHAVGLLKSKDIPVDWRQLLSDLLRWEYADRQVHRRWSRDFWAGGQALEQAAAESTPSSHTP
ncbi:MAG: type I-E CRISPR-associated protein Cse2/CasB [Thermoguttaceae bacterium]